MERNFYNPGLIFCVRLQSALTFLTLELSYCVRGTRRMGDKRRSLVPYEEVDDPDEASRFMEDWMGLLAAARPLSHY